MTMEAITLKMDKSRPFATVHGDREANDTHVRVSFFQDGLPFDAAGNLVLSVIENDQKLLDLARRKSSKFKSNAQPQEETSVVSAPPPPQLLADESYDDVDSEGAEAQDPDDVSQGDIDAINLTEWAKGNIKYSWFKVRDAFRQRYSINVSSANDAIDFLLSEGVVSEGDLRRGSNA